MGISARKVLQVVNQQRPHMRIGISQTVSAYDGVPADNVGNLRRGNVLTATCASTERSVTPQHHVRSAVITLARGQDRQL